MRFSRSLPSSSSISAEPESLSLSSEQPIGRYTDNGAQMVIDAAAKAVEKLRSLPSGQKEAFAAGFQELTAKLRLWADELIQSRKALSI